MKVIIPAGGKGNRLRPHTLFTPKPLLFVAGDTIIGHIFSTIEDLEIDEYRVVYSPEGSLPRMLKESFPDKNFTFWEQAEPLGLGHAVLQGLGGLKDEPVLVLLSDTIIPFDVGKAFEGVVEGEGFLVAKEVDDPERFGVIELRGDYVSNMIEKPSEPESNLAICGVYYLPSAKRLRESLEELVVRNQRTRGEYQLTDALAILVRNGEKLKAVKVDKWIDCGTSEALLDANRELLKLRTRIVPFDDSLIKPPCWIGDHVRICNSIIGPNVSVAKEASIKNSIVSDAIINREAKVEGMVIDRAIVGEKAVVKRSSSSPDLGSFSRLQDL
ncbi:NTP transferase domain-containing protein [candidate division WOR-3 bacterium]|nr:NTP transferase domain-containing protein [candidate division WOR-3 bacterium]